MTKYIKDYEIYILEAINKKENFEKLSHYHHKQILWLQHERLIHLLVLMLTAMLFILAFVGMLFLTILATILIVILLGTLLLAYIIHYYRLENTVQRWYKIANTLYSHLNGIGCNLF